jgi:hypothetical protein
MPKKKERIIIRRQECVRDAPGELVMVLIDHRNRGQPYAGINHEID